MPAVAVISGGREVVTMWLETSIALLHAMASASTLSRQCGIAIASQWIKEVVALVTCRTAIPAPPAFVERWQDPSNWTRKIGSSRGGSNSEEAMLIYGASGYEVDMKLPTLTLFRN